MTFRDILPLVNGLGWSGPPIEAARRSKFLIHLVDDDDAVRRSLARLLTLSGYEVKEYASGSELLEAAHELGGGCVLLDLNMPEANGFAVHRALKDMAVDVPVILMTGADDLTVSPLRAVVAGVLQKPFRRAELLSLLENVYAAPQAGPEAP